MHESYDPSNDPLPHGLFPRTCSHLTSPHVTSPHLTSPHLTSPHLLISPHLTHVHAAHAPHSIGGSDHLPMGCLIFRLAVGLGLRSGACVLESSHCATTCVPHSAHAPRAVKFTARVMPISHRRGGPPAGASAQPLPYAGNRRRLAHLAESTALLAGDSG